MRLESGEKIYGEVWERIYINIHVFLKFWFLCERNTEYFMLIKNKQINVVLVLINILFEYMINVSPCLKIDKNLNDF